MAINPDESASVVAINAVPTGCIMPYVGNTPPNGWLICDGSLVDGNLYPNLYGFLAPNGGKLPDLRNRFPLGAGPNYTLWASGGESTHTLAVNEMPAHSHSIYRTTNQGSGEYARTGFFDICIGDRGGAYSPLSDQNNAWVQDSGGTQPHNNMPPYLALTFIIKT